MSELTNVETLAKFVYGWAKFKWAIIELVQEFRAANYLDYMTNICDLHNNRPLSMVTLW